MTLFVHDGLLGHVPNPGFSTPGFGGSFHTIDADGLRFSGEKPASNFGSVLAVGDSFTYGDEVLDEQTWPAQLQKLTGRRVLNGGVTGYGLDQIVLRAEQLTALHRPSVVIVSFIAHDILRMEMRCMWWRDKPWFEIEGGQLTLKGVPVPQRTGLPLRMRNRVEGVLVDLPPWLQQLVGYHTRVHPAGRGLAIAQRLVERLAQLHTRYGARIIVMAQYPPEVWNSPTSAARQRRDVRVILDCATLHGLATLDTFQRLATEPKPLNFYGSSHMTARGNSMIASLLSATLPTLLQRRPESGNSETTPDLEEDGDLLRRKSASAGRSP